jgi:hypothetical protein
MRGTRGPQARQVRWPDAYADTGTRPRDRGFAPREIERHRRLGPVALRFCNVAPAATAATQLLQLAAGPKQKQGEPPITVARCPLVRGSGSTVGPLLSPAEPGAEEFAKSGIGATASGRTSTSEKWASLPQRGGFCHVVGLSQWRRTIDR